MLLFHKVSFELFHYVRFKDFKKWVLKYWIISNFSAKFHSACTSSMTYQYIISSLFHERIIYCYYIYCLCLNSNGRSYFCICLAFKLYTLSKWPLIDNLNVKEQLFIFCYWHLNVVLVTILIWVIFTRAY